DVISGGDGDDLIDGGTGADTMTGGAGSDTFNISAGDTTVSIGGSGNAGTIAGFDRITDFSTSEDILNIGGNPPQVAANTSGTNGIDSTLTIGGSTIKSHAITNGII